MIEVRLPPVLREITNGEKVVYVDGLNVGDVLDALCCRFPALRASLFQGSDLRTYVNVFVDGALVRDANLLSRPVEDGQRVILLPAAAGGTSQAPMPSIELSMRA